MAGNYQMRRIPSTEHGKRRVKAILDAAAHIFAEVGFGHATTNAIAKRSGSSIGALYSFFPNKESILRALSERYLAQLERLNESVFTTERIQRLTLPELIEQIVDAFALFCLDEPGFEYIFYGSEARDYLRAVSRQIHYAIVRQVENVIDRHVPHLEADERNIVANLAVAAMQAIMPFVITADNPRQQAILAHLKLMLISYLRTLAQHAA
jgi:AcrR family transcriptional regulator